MRFRPLQFWLKHRLDLLGALWVLLLVSPLWAFIAIAIKLDDGGEVFFRQERVGQDGRPFQLWKFRTMRPDAEAIGKGYFPDGLQLITRVGRFLRRTSLDELPQLINIIRGDMSFVGPRPTLREQVERYDATQRRRLEVRPGIAGWAQLHGRNTLPWSRRIEYDVEYVDRASLLFDLRILLRTVPQVLKGEGIRSDQKREDVDDLRPSR
jgi:lipopolysaccharide/colanic/teichoic acid biosynthesis glycosyltransferase